MSRSLKKGPFVDPKLYGKVQQQEEAGTKEPNPDLAWDIVNTCFREGLMMFAPVGVSGGCVKMAPPLCITEEAVLEACDVIYNALKKLT